MQLTSNMGADYEAAFGDIFDVTLTGVIDRDVEVKGDGDKKKRYSTGTIRKLYFRETPLIDAGGRFAFGAVPEYMVFDKEDMGAEFVRVVEEGMEKSKTSFKNKTVSTPKPVKTESTPVKDTDDILDDIDDELPFEEDASPSETVENNYPDDLDAVIRKMFKECTDADLKAAVRGVISEYGKLNDVDEEGLRRIYDMMI